MWVLSVGNSGISVYTAALFSKQRQSKKYIFLAQFLEFVYIFIEKKKTQIPHHLLSLSKRR
jgi:hypothetical protein